MGLLKKALYWEVSLRVTNSYPFYNIVDRGNIPFNENDTPVTYQTVENKYCISFQKFLR